MQTIGSPVDYLSLHRKRAIEELLRGRESANQLRLLVSKPFPLHGSAAQDLLAQVLGSLTDTIFMLKNSSAADEFSQIPENAGVNSPPWDGRKSEDSYESSKTSSASKEPRGCHKRRKTSRTWTTVSPTIIDDGHAWRKYGQKLILNAKHPRSYYRCTHKYDQGCQATKQVQKTEDETPMYRTTYYGHHTCKNLLNKSPQAHIILDSNPRGSVLLSFGSTIPVNQSDEPRFPAFPLIKQEYKEDKPTSISHDQSSTSDYLLSPDPTTLESSWVYSCTDSPHGSGLDLGTMADVNIDDVFAI
ncbi:hypothetical protein NMG60_11000052 [Bertholletia excelsa]